MKTCLIYMSVFLMLLGAGHAHAQNNAQDQRFFETLYDVPVMRGLQELPDYAMTFDKANGRLAEAGASMAGYSADAVMDFYKTALFQMGWLYEGPLKAAKTGYYFTREGERLDIMFDQTLDDNLVLFTLGPGNPKKS